MDFTFFVFLDNQWLYAGIKMACTPVNQIVRNIPFDAHQGFYGKASEWIPIAAKDILIVPEDTIVTFELFSGSSYGSRVRNFIMTAERINDQ